MNIWTKRFLLIKFLKYVVCISNNENILGGIYYDYSISAPIGPSQSDIIKEVKRAVTYFGNTAPHANDNNIYVISTASGLNPTNIGVDHCAYHSYTTTSTRGIRSNIPFIYIPYITDAGYACGANFNNLGVAAGITLAAA